METFIKDAVIMYLIFASLQAFERIHIQSIRNDAQKAWQDGKSK